MMAFESADLTRFCTVEDAYTRSLVHLHFAVIWSVALMKKPRLRRWPCRTHVLPSYPEMCSRGRIPSDLWQSVCC